ncbi:hypothetical protein [Acidocella sp.]|uniref:hypothetical protein n=1 Tax=Acidocella sp. TaxID=50710 RepID=UPI00182B4D51|nr:hypothetical protein [Acidocella sp.]NNM56253.1 hypothetical protein [Acidocella sp.]
MNYDTDPVHSVLPEQLGEPETADIEFCGWYFWDETWSDRHGPFASRDEANAACILYARAL